MRSLVLCPFLILSLCLAACTTSSPWLVPDAPPLPADRTFSGTVVRVDESENAAPVTDTGVRWMLDLRPARLPGLARRTTGDGRTDAQGRFVLPSPPAEEGYFSLWCDAVSGWTLLSSALWFAEDNQWEDDEEYELQGRDRPWRVRIHDASGRPVAGARVELVLSVDGAPIGEMRPTVRTGADGVAEIHGLEYGNYWADISAPGFAPVRMATHQFSEAMMGDDASDSHTLPRGRRLSVRVVTPAGELPPGTDLRIEYDTDRGGSAWHIALRMDGSADVIVPETGSVELEVRAPGYAPAGARVESVTDLVLVLVPESAGSQP